MDSDRAPADVDKKAAWIAAWQDALPIGIRVGPEKAPVKVIEFADFECPFCAQFDATVHAIRENYPEEVSITFVHYPLAQHEFAKSAARAAECAHSQGSFEPMRKLLFDKQQSFGLIPWTDLAAEARVPDMQEFRKCIDGTESLHRLTQSRELGAKFNIKATPTVIVNGWKLQGTPSTDEMATIVTNILDGRSALHDTEFIVLDTDNGGSRAELK